MLFVKYMYLGFMLDQDEDPTIFTFFISSKETVTFVTSQQKFLSRGLV